MATSVVHNVDTVIYRINYNTRYSAIAETVLQGALVLAKSGRLELRDNIYLFIYSIFNHRDIMGLQSYRIR